MRFAGMVVLTLLASPCFGQDFQLAPGEILIAVNGVPVSQSPGYQGSVTQAQSTAVPSAGISQSVFNGNMGVQPASYATPQRAASNGLVVNRDPVAYAHALREASIIAARGEGYHRAGDGGHPLGVAPGCRYAGTGYSRDPNRPNHCYQGELPESRLVARAMVPGPNGTYFWSAHYR